MKKIFFSILILLGILLGIAFLYFFVGSAPQTETVFGVNFSQKHAQNLGLDWKAVYEALLNDPGAKRIKIAVHWDLIEPTKGVFSFEDLDWQMAKLKEYKARALLVVGMKTPRWPECHIPNWARGLSRENQQKEILTMLENVVKKYKDASVLLGWQVENEPFFPFGECPWADEKFLKQEVSLVKSLDSNHRIVISESGEGSFWTKAARYGDRVGITMYRKVWVRQLRAYFTYPFPPVFYWRKVQIVHALSGKEVIDVELQAEPWGPKLLYDLPLKEQKKTMNLEQFKKNIEFAKNTGLKEHYLWGAEWWYWMKEQQHDPSIWNEAKKLFILNQ